MSVRGFRLNGVVHKYAYDALDNKPTPDTTLTESGKPADSKAVGDAISEVRQAVGSPLVAATAAAMTDTSKIYVYTGSESGYTSGNWYYYNGTSWVSGGVYNSSAVETDKTLSVSDKAADAKTVGDRISEVAAAAGTVDAIAPEFELKAYSKGDLVFYENVLYQANTNTYPVDIEGQPVWPSTSFDEVTIDDVINGDIVNLIARRFINNEGWVREVGTYVVYGDKLYRVTEANSDTIWNASKYVEVASIGAEINNIKSSVSALGTTVSNLSSELSEAKDDITELKNDLSQMKTATSEDVGKALKAKTVTDGKVTEWEFGEAGSKEETDELKRMITALKAPFVNALEHVVWSDGDGQTYIGDIATAFDTFNLSHITATYTNPSPVSVLDTLDILKQYITVTAHNIDGTTNTIDTARYDLSGSLYNGSNTITVSYSGQTTTVTVEATAPSVPTGYTAYDYIKRTLNVGSSDGKGANSIITDVAMTPDYTMEMNVFLLGGSSNNYYSPVCGSNAYGNTYLAFKIVVSEKLQLLGYNLYGVSNVSGASNITGEMAFTVGEWHTVKVKPVGASKEYPDYATILIDDVEYPTNFSGANKNAAPWLTFFSFGNSATSTEQGGSLIEHGLRIGTVTIRDKDDVCIHYFIPVYDGTHYGIYDAVADKMYYSAENYDNFICENK